MKTFSVAIRRVALLALVMLLGVPVRGQDEVPAESGPAVNATDASAKQMIDEMKQSEELALSGQAGYNYDPAGRPDPFVDPVKQATEGERGAPRPDGWQGMLINEVKLRGITVFGVEPIAVFLGTDGVGYFAREGDELWDGKIEVIDFDQEMVVFKQKVEDPSSPIRHRRVERKLHP